MKALNLFFLEENMKISNYFAKEKMDDATFIQTFIEKLNELTDEDIGQIQIYLKIMRTFNLY
jgi:hypothetical protein